MTETMINTFSCPVLAQHRNRMIIENRLIVKTLLEINLQYVRPDMYMYIVEVLELDLFF